MSVGVRLFLCPLSQNHPLGNVGSWETTCCVLYPWLQCLYVTEGMFSWIVMTLKREEKLQMDQYNLGGLCGKRGWGMLWELGKRCHFPWVDTVNPVPRYVVWQMEWRLHFGSLCSCRWATFYCGLEEPSWGQNWEINFSDTYFYTLHVVSMVISE